MSKHITLWRDSNFVVHARNIETGSTYQFHDYAGAISGNEAMKNIISREVVQDLTAFLRWTQTGEGKESDLLNSLDVISLDG